MNYLENEIKSNQFSGGSDWGEGECRLDKLCESRLTSFKSRVRGTRKIK